jgi:hypothetical protein
MEASATDLDFWKEKLSRNGIVTCIHARIKNSQIFFNGLNGECCLLRCNAVWLLLEAIHSSETSVLTLATLRHIPEDGIRHSYRSENLKSYIAFTGLALTET